MDTEAVLEFRQHVEDFRRGFLVRAMFLLAGLVWAIGMIALLLEPSAQGAGLLLSFEATCGISYWLGRRGHSPQSRHFFAAAMVVWSLALVWVLGDPALLFVPTVIAAFFAAFLDVRPTICYALLLIGGQILIGRALFPETWYHWHMLLAPGLALVGMLLALIWDLDLAMILRWALHSTRAAVERLEEVQQNRVQLSQSMHDLDAACQRLERANEMLTQARAEADAARQARNQFALTVSHELRTPLNFIIGFSELMVNAPTTYGEQNQWPPGLYEDVSEIYHSSNHLLRLVNDILELGRAEAHGLILVKEWTTPRQIVEEVQSIMRAAVLARGLALTVQVAPDLPELFVDRTRIRQVLINLLGNSLRFTERGGIAVTVDRQGEEILFCVTDTGPGIAADEIEKVFESFGQANATVWRRRDGSGLGVPISRRFVEMHGGRMWLESQVGQGTAFQFTLPLPGASAETILPAPDARSGCQPLFAGQKSAPRLLLVLSRDPNAGDVVAGIVEGYWVWATGQPAAARAQIVSALPHALIVDDSLSDDADVTALVQGLPYDLPVFVFRLPGSGVQVRELPASVHSYLVKPVMRESLAAAIDALPIPVRSILVVDDDPAMARFVSLALQAASAERPAMQTIQVQSATTAWEALACLGGTDPGVAPLACPDAILLDLRLPDMSGWDVIAALQQSPDWRNIPVILVTATSLPEELDLRERKALQVSTFRPLAQEELAHALCALLQAIRPKFAAASAVLPEQTANLSE